MILTWLLFLWTNSVNCQIRQKYLKFKQNSSSHEVNLFSLEVLSMLKLTILNDSFQFGHTVDKMKSFEGKLRTIWFSFWFSFSKGSTQYFQSEEAPFNKHFEAKNIHSIMFWTTRHKSKFSLKVYISFLHLCWLTNPTM